ncbi:hypothetical protein ASC75_10240 [Aminobacter sp. DSM 101952]|nr:hypothetical protein ASC75_10240 [Aminobacter sp. DSM 101952]
MTGVLNGWSASSRQSGNSRSMPIGSTTAPDRICAPTSPPFSSTTTESSGLTCLSRIAAASPAGPAPTMTTSNSMLSRSISLIFEPDRRRQSRRPGADDDNVEFHALAFDIAHLSLRVGWPRPKGEIWLSAA